MKGVKGTGTEVDIKGDWDDASQIWGYFSRGLVGSGQMATNTFAVKFPEDYAIEKLRGVECLVSALVKKIMYKVDKDPEPEDRVRERCEGEVSSYVY